MIVRKILIAIILSLVWIPVWANLVSDPLDDYLSKYGPWLTESKAKEILVLELDLNNDGRNEILISSDIRRHFRSGYTWMVYLSEKDGYVLSNSGISPSFFPEAVYYGYIDELGKVGLLNYHPGSSTDGELVAYSIDEKKLSEHNLGTISPSGTDKELFEKYFDKKVVGVEVKTEDLAQVMSAHGQRTETNKPNKPNLGKEEIEFSANNGPTKPTSESAKQLSEGSGPASGQKSLAPNRTIWMLLAALVVLLLMAIVVVKRKKK